MRKHLLWPFMIIATAIMALGCWVAGIQFEFTKSKGRSDNEGKYDRSGDSDRYDER